MGAETAEGAGAPDAETPCLRFLCDEMLHSLARWLRAAGYDTEVAIGRRSDHDLLARSLAERRVLLTKDRALASAAARDRRVLLLRGGSIDDDARQLRERLGVDWQHSPFRRCLVDNAPLTLAGPEHLARVPSRSRAAGGPLWLCPDCGRLYWPGSHVRRMQQRLARWQQE